jgi:OOP family OmpA-OmpF porin
MTALSDESDAVVDAVSGSYARCDLYKLEIRGHADASGDAVTNQVISAARAEAVLEALKTRGVDAERVHLVAYGEQDAVTASGADEPLNRKTEVRLVPEG